MSSALAIVAVTAVLKDLLENSLVSDSIATSIGDVIVTALPPDRISVGVDERAQLNLFLYQVTQNRNADWVAWERRSPHTTSIQEDCLPPIGGLRSINPPLALDLHYLLTAYGTKDFQAELLLGYMMQLFHEIPTLTRDVIQASLSRTASVSTSGILSQALAAVSVSDLADQMRQIKIYPEFFNMEETSRLWSALQTHYRPSAAYQISMVLLESRCSTKPPAKSFQEPTIEQAMAVPDQLINGGSTLILRGKQLRAVMTRIRLSQLETLLVPQDLEETQISLPLPSDLSAGIHGVQVVHLNMGKSSEAQSTIESNLAAFVLSPTIMASVHQAQGSGHDLRSTKVTVKFSPKVSKSQRVTLLLNRVSSSVAAYSFAVAPRTADTDLITIPIKNVKAGTYLVRVQVDGAESLLRVNQAGEYDSPQVTIP